MKVYFWIENNSDRKYINFLINSLKKSIDEDVYIYDRINKRIVDENDNVLVKMGDATSFLKYINNEDNVYLISGYNLRKRDIEKYKNINVIQISHSMAGWTGYNIRTLTPYYDKMKSIIPDMFYSMEYPSTKRQPTLKRFINLLNNRYNVVTSDVHYRLLALLNKLNESSNVSRDNKTVLCLFHWTTKLSTIYDLFKNKLSKDLNYIIKLHPSSINEKSIFMNRQALGSEVTTQKEKEGIFNDYLNKIKKLDNVTLVDDNELEYLESIMMYKHVLFDNCSNTLIETIAINQFRDQNKIVCVKLDAYNDDYLLPDNLGVPVLDKVESLDDFVKANKFDRYKFNRFPDLDMSESINKTCKLITKNYSKLIKDLVNKG